jgi:UDP-N-acetylglucosamine 4-epimerase
MDTKLNTYHTKDLSQSSFLITGGAGFIGSHLVEYLVYNNAGKIRILDNLSTGNLDNISKFIDLPNVEFIEGDIRNFEVCKSVVENIDYISHQAALGSVPRSISDPITTNEVNISGFLNMLTAAKDSKVKRMIYAASSSSYGDSEKLPKQENVIGNPLSPYAVTKYVNELYGQVFSTVYGLHTIGLRYFNVFGPKQNPAGQYAAVIPLFISAMLKSESPVINGDGRNSRDFTFVSNVVEANIKAMLTEDIKSHTVLNIAYGNRISLLELVQAINQDLNTMIKPTFRETRKGDVKHSFADITKAKKMINYEPKISFMEGIKQTISYFKGNNS